MSTGKRKRIIDERTSGRDDHPTPRWLVQRISEFGHSWQHILSHFKKEARGIGLDPSGGKKAPVSALSRTVWTGYNKRTRKGIDGLRNPWTGHGLVFCNPPYGRQIRAWADKAVEQFGSYTRFLRYTATNDADELIMLVAARVDTRWFKLLWRHSAAVLLFDRRLQFEGQTDPAKFPNAMIYFGTRPEQFRDAFANLGLVIVNVKPTTTLAAIQNRNVRLFFPPLPVVGTHEHARRKTSTRTARSQSVPTRRRQSVRAQRQRHGARTSSRGRRVR